jgi:hypothetical protein
MLEGGTSASGESGGWTREVSRVLADFAVALALFWLIALGISGSDIRAHAVALPVIAKEAVLAEPVAPSRIGAGGADTRPLIHSTVKAQGGGRDQGLLLLSLAFAAILACNLAFFRHLRRVYASPRRSVWRRGRPG